MMNTMRQRSRAGFTLVEIMIALGIFMMVILAIYSTWSAVLRASKTGLEAAATAQRARVAVHAIEDSLTCATMFAANPRYYSFLADADASGDFSTLTFTSHLPASFPGSGLFGDQAVRRISFFVEPDPVSRRRLVMMQTPLMEEASDKPQGYPLVLARGVTMFVLEYWDNRKGDWVVDPLPPTNQLPAMVRFTLGISLSTDPSAPPEVVTRVVKIASSVVVPSMQAPLLPPTAPFVPPAVGPGAAPGVPGQIPRQAGNFDWILGGIASRSGVANTPPPGGQYAWSGLGDAVLQSGGPPGSGPPMDHGVVIAFVPGGPASP